MLFILVAVGRIGEIIPGLSAIPLVKIALGIAIIVLIRSWKLLPPFDVSIKPPLVNALWLVVLVLVSVPFSIWPGPSFNYLYQVLPVLVVAVLLVTKLSSSWRSALMILTALMGAGACLALTALSRFGGGRIAVASMYDTNDLAYVLVTTFPLALGLAFTAESRQRKIVFWGLTAAFIASILLTQSRGGLLGLTAALIIVVLNTGKLSVVSDAESPARVRVPKKQQARPIKRILVSLAICACIGAVVWPFLPQATRERLATVVNLGSDYNMNAEDDTGRTQIWKRGMTALSERPLGYGVASFGMVDFKHGGRMLAPHNSLVQISVELGVIAVTLYLRMYVLIWRRLTATRRILMAINRPTRLHNQQAVLCRMLQACLAGTFVSGFFLSMAYATVLWLTFAVSLACIAVIHRDHAGLRSGTEPT